ncbi:MAG: serine acetyltransferase [Clostridia bacterium]|nr:serine acetyltransferase [Clostridia bacterium]
MPDNKFFDRISSSLNEGEETNAKAPDRHSVACVADGIRSLMFPQYLSSVLPEDPAKKTRMIFERLKEQVELAFAFAGEDGDARKVCEEFFEKLPAIKSALKKDIRAIYEGDPAARSEKEVLLCYPGFTAISIYRIAHEFYLMKVPYLHRLLTEYAHEITGIDIHAGATIGEYFCIDHGTGTVIGETTVIGNRVKLYQGVTLGARSFETDENGNPIKGIKRHPNIGNNVVIYANATILGGDTFIGDNCVIGGSVWLTSSVPANQKVYYSATQQTK